MAQLDALALSESIRNRLVDFSLDDHFVRDPELTRICREIWSGPAGRGGLVGDLWVESAPPSLSSGVGLADLATRGSFDPALCAHLDDRGVMPRDRPLYSHQLAAIERAGTRRDGARPALVVTAGTGTGKTESFLLPVLGDLFSRPRLAGQGVRCLILYPMNALVNDQVDRLYEWLRGQNRLTLFHFTSETPEDWSRAEQEGFPRWDDPCRMRTRRQARGLEAHDGRPIPPDSPRGPQPDILVTNYSMLEYMLCRPQDADFFGPSLRAVVLDEAHLYTGTLAAEITLLLRRLLERCGLEPEQVLHLATSATIGGGEDEMRSFASTLFTKPDELVSVIMGSRTRVEFPPPRHPVAAPTAAAVAAATWLTSPTLESDADGSIHLAVRPEACEALARELPQLVDQGAVADAERRAGGRPAVLLHAALSPAPLIQRAEQILSDRERLPLTELAHALWGTREAEAVRATVALLQMGAAGRERVGAYPLLPHRIHLLSRPTDGLVACLNAECTSGGRA